MALCKESGVFIFAETLTGNYADDFDDDASPGDDDDDDDDDVIDEEIPEEGFSDESCSSSQSVEEVVYVSLSFLFFVIIFLCHLA